MTPDVIPEISPGAELESLRRFRDRKPERTPGEHCEMCTQEIPPEGMGHAHVVQLDSRSLLCACRACYLLFTVDGAAGGRYRAVPEDFRFDPSFTLTTRQWDALQIPVRMAFFFFNSAADGVVAFYPSPAGATESLLDLDAWAELVAANPSLATVAPDVEALIVRRTDDGFASFLVPIDSCYELVGLVKLHWKGFDGGEEAWHAIDGFFDAVRARSRRWEARP